MLPMRESSVQAFWRETVNVYQDLERVQKFEPQIPLLASNLREKNVSCVQ